MAVGHLEILRWWWLSSVDCYRIQGQSPCVFFWPDSSWCGYGILWVTHLELLGQRSGSPPTHEKDSGLTKLIRIPGSPLPLFDIQKRLSQRWFGYNHIAQQCYECHVYIFLPNPTLGLQPELVTYCLAHHMVDLIRTTLAVSDRNPTWGSLSEKRWFVATFALKM